MSYTNLTGLYNFCEPWECSKDLQSEHFSTGRFKEDKISNYFDVLLDEKNWQKFFFRSAVNFPQKLIQANLYQTFWWNVFLEVYFRTTSTVPNKTGQLLECLLFCSTFSLTHTSKFNTSWWSGQSYNNDFCLFSILV